jgi:ABC-2 type transport system permease protein
VSSALSFTPSPAPSALVHRLRAMQAVVRREVGRFLRQPARLGAALVRPLLWLVVFAAGFHNVFGVAIIPPYDTYIDYRLYVVPGLLGMVALFNGMQSSLALVYDRETGAMRLLLTAPLPRSWLLLSKLLAAAFLSLLQMLVFALMAWALDLGLGLMQIVQAVPVMLLVALMLAALGLWLSVYVRQLENFAGAMNFVIFPMFFISSALYPLWKLRESGAVWIEQLAWLNPFTHAVEALRFALHGQFNLTSTLVVLGALVVASALAIRGYDPQRGWIRNKGDGA